MFKMLYKIQREVFPFLFIIRQRESGEGGGCCWDRGMDIARSKALQLTMTSAPEEQKPSRLLLHIACDSVCLHSFLLLGVNVCEYISLLAGQSGCCVMRLVIYSENSLSVVDI